MSNPHLYPHLNLDEISSDVAHHFEREGKYLRKLTNSAPFDFSLASSGQFQDLDECTSKLTSKISSWLKHHKNKLNASNRAIRRTLRCLILNAIFHKKLYISYSRTPRSYTKNLYNRSGVGFKTLILTLEALQFLGYIKDHYIAKRSESKHRISSRFRFSNLFLEIVGKINCYIYPSVTIIVKNSNKELVVLKNQDLKTKQIQKNLNVIYYHGIMKVHYQVDTNKRKKNHIDHVD